MKEKILKVIAFFAILALILGILTLIFIPKNNTEKAGMYNAEANGILGEKENTIDIVVVGNSESFTSIIPLKIWKDCGYTTYLCGTASQTSAKAVKMAFRATKDQKPKLMIFETDAIFCEKPVTEAIEKVIEYNFPLIEYHDRWKDLNSQDFYKKPKCTWTDYMKGYDYSNATAGVDDSNYMIYSDEKEPITKINKLCVKILKEYCKKNNIQFLLLSTPNLKNWDYKKHNAVKEFADEEQIEFIDLNVLQDKVDINWSLDTKDTGNHLNHYGASKVTQYLEEYFKDKNIFEDHRKDEKYEKWNEALKKYEERIKNKQ